MKKILHLTIAEPLPNWAQQIVATQKQNGGTEVETFQLTTANASIALEKIFAADSICVWPGNKTNKE